VVRLKDASQLKKREMLAKHTHRISVFAEGIMAMEQTKLGMIEINPREVLEDGIRKELVRTMSDVMQRGLIFQDGKKILNTEQQLKTIATQLQGFKSAFEYIQDYVSIYGLKMWQEEFSRIVSFNVEQECNVFLKRKSYHNIPFIGGELFLYLCIHRLKEVLQILWVDYVIHY